MERILVRNAAPAFWQIFWHGRTLWQSKFVKQGANHYALKIGCEIRQCHRAEIFLSEKNVGFELVERCQKIAYPNDNSKPESMGSAVRGVSEEKRTTVLRREELMDVCVSCRQAVRDSIQRVYEVAGVVGRVTHRRCGIFYPVI